jgi:carbonic anhydrase
MKLHQLLRLALLTVTILALGAFASVSLAQDEDEEIHWEYEGDNGPENWGDLNPDYETCSSGEAQSPIDIAFESIVFAEPDVFPVYEADYQPSAINIVNNGHTIQFNYDEGSTLSIDDEVYNLLQFHFHIPSEHTIAGEQFDMEMHLVHANEDGDLAVLGIMLAVNPDEEATDVLDLIWSDLPSEEGEAELDGEVNAADFLPEVLDILTYQGSLTTPPCSEGVTWMLSGEALTVEQEIVDDFGAIFEFNNRPTQPVNDRALTASN